VRAASMVSGLWRGAVAPGHHGYPRSQTDLRRRPQRAGALSSLLAAPGRPFVHLFIPSRRPRRGSFQYCTSWSSPFWWLMSVGSC